MLRIFIRKRMRVLTSCVMILPARYSLLGKTEPASIVCWVQTKVSAKSFKSPQNIIAQIRSASIGSWLRHNVQGVSLNSVLPSSLSFTLKTSHSVRIKRNCQLTWKKSVVLLWINDQNSQLLRNGMLNSTLTTRKSGRRPSLPWLNT